MAEATTTKRATTKAPAKRPTAASRKPKLVEGRRVGLDLNDVPSRYRDLVLEIIPEYRIAENYINRTVFPTMSDFDVFDLAQRTKHNVLMPGPTGSGKTTAGRAYAAMRGVPFVSVEMQGGFDFASTVGSTRAVVQDGVAVPDFVMGEVSVCVGLPSVIFIDESNFAPPRFTAAFHGTLDARQSLYIAELGQRLRKHADCLIFSAYNPGYAGTIEMNEAFINRFAFVLPWDYSPEVEEALVGAYSPRLLAMCRDMRKEKLIKTPIGTNVMEEFITITAESGNANLAAWLFCNRFPGAERTIVTRTWEANAAAIRAELSDLTGDSAVQPVAFADEEAAS